MGPECSSGAARATRLGRSPAELVGRYHSWNGTLFASPDRRPPTGQVPSSATAKYLVWTSNGPVIRRNGIGAGRWRILEGDAVLLGDDSMLSWLRRNPDLVRVFIVVFVAHQLLAVAVLGLMSLTYDFSEVGWGTVYLQVGVLFGFTLALVGAYAVHRTLRGRDDEAL